ncbi:unnamed protein product [Closterium sp. Naga37s-1]|nr:unnamed protein product [Closterium sp. Naga37s-1]
MIISQSLLSPLPLRSPFSPTHPHLPPLQFFSSSLTYPPPVPSFPSPAPAVAQPAAGARKLTSPQTSALYAVILFLIVLSLQQVNRATLASSKPLTIVGGFVSALLFLLALTFFSNMQEAMGARSGWGVVFLSLFIATVAAASVHGVCATTCILFSAGLLFEVQRVSVAAYPSADAKKKN